MSILYPYDGTVWPQGLLAPLLQWNPGAHAFDSVYVHIKENNFEYKGYFAAEHDRRLREPADPAGGVERDGVLERRRARDRLARLRAGGERVRPLHRDVDDRAGALQGTIYYNSYGTALVQNSDGNRLLRTPVRRGDARDRTRGRRRRRSSPG